MKNILYRIMKRFCPKEKMLYADGIEPDDFRIAALAKQQKEYFGHE